MRSCSSEFNLWMSFSVEILCFFMNHRIKINRSTCLAYIVCILHGFMQLTSCSVLQCALRAVSSLSLPVPRSSMLGQYSMIPIYGVVRGVQNVTLGKMADLSAMTQSLPEKSRTGAQVRFQVRCSFNPDRKNFTIYSGHSSLNTPKCLLSGFTATACISLCLKSWLAI